MSDFKFGDVLKPLPSATERSPKDRLMFVSFDKEGDHEDWAYQDGTPYGFHAVILHLENGTSYGWIDEWGTKSWDRV